MLDTVFRLLKISVITAVCASFMIIISNLISMLTSLIFHNVVGEFFSLISMYLPFNASIVFGMIGTSISAILAFLIGKKIFDLTSWSISAI